MTNFLKKNNNLKIFYGKKHNKKGKFSIEVYSDDLAMGITKGQVSKPNEDCVGFRMDGSVLKIGVADGHWGREAAEIAVDKFLKNDFKIGDEGESIKLLEKVEKEICKKFKKKESIPETSIIYVQVEGNKISVASYGDCLGMKFKKGRGVLLNRPVETWLGKYSASSSEGRLSIDQGLRYNSFEVEEGACYLFVTDGIFEYAGKNFGMEEIGILMDKFLSAGKILEKMMEKVLESEVKDNVACVLFKS